MIKRQKKDKFISLVFQAAATPDLLTGHLVRSAGPGLSDVALAEAGLGLLVFAAVATAVLQALVVAVAPISPGAPA